MHMRWSLLLVSVCVNWHKEAANIQRCGTGKCEVGAGSACHKWRGGGRAGRGERPRWQVTDPDAELPFGQNQLSGSCQLAFVVGLFLLLQLPLSILDEESSRDSTPPLPAMQEDDKKEEVTLLLCPHRHQSWLDFPFLKCPYFWQIENCSSSASPLASIYDVIGGCYSLHKLPWSLWGNYFLERLHQHPTYW